MLKIKDEIDLKELEKFGYVNLKTCYYKDCDFDISPSWIIRIDCKSHKIECWNCDNGKTKNVTPYIKDLIQAGYVTKV